MADTPNRPPLWEVMYEAFWKCPRENWRLSSYYMLLALRDWLFPEETPPLGPAGKQNMHLRALLTAEAERAERGNVDTLRYTPRYIRNSYAFGWQGADDPNGPWRSISPPESGTPFQTTNPMSDLHQASADVSGVKVLSPAAQAVMMAATNGNINVVNDPVYRQCIAAALRAAVEQVRTDPNLKRHIHATMAEMMTLNKILAIATELEDAND